MLVIFLNFYFNNKKTYIQNNFDGNFHIIKKTFLYLLREKLKCLINIKYFFPSIIWY